MFLHKLMLLQLVNILTTQAIINKNAVKTENTKVLQSAGTFYLNSERPLWLLKDLKDEHLQLKISIKDKGKHNVPQNSALSHHQRRQRQQILKEKQFNVKADNHSIYNKNYRGVHLPHNYIPVKKIGQGPAVAYSRRYHNSKAIQSMPVFDAVPGNEAYTRSSPIFIYTGTKGRMLVNTMLSKRKYPMQEPVPGQTLYPPQPSVFKPYFLVDSLQHKLNVTMIPFYPYEAINPRAEDHSITTTASYVSSSSGGPANKDETGKRYTAFHSPHEVHTQQATGHYEYNIESTTNTPLALDKPYAQNHRLNDLSVSTTTPLPHRKFEVNYNDGEDKFQITYEDDTTHLERPLNVQASTLAPLPYESYTIDKQYYAFPVYTMAKLLEGHETSTPAGNKTDQLKHTDKDQSLLFDDANEDTWLILNSRYKGPLKTSTENLLSSKYKRLETHPTDTETKII